MNGDRKVRPFERGWVSNVNCSLVEPSVVCGLVGSWNDIQSSDYNRCTVENITRLTYKYWNSPQRKLGNIPF